MTNEEKNLICFYFLQSEKNNLLRKKNIPPSSELTFNTDWNKLIDVCRKFDDLNLDVTEYVKFCDEIDHLVACYEIEPVFEEIVKAIIWYNENY